MSARPSKKPFPGGHSGPEARNINQLRHGKSNQSPKTPEQPLEKTAVSDKTATSGSSIPGLKADKLAYIFDMLKEIQKMSATINEPMITYLVEMALLETATACNVSDFSEDLGKSVSPGNSDQDLAG